jgi:hypothetical protein
MVGSHLQGVGLTEWEEWFGWEKEKPQSVRSPQVADSWWISQRKEPERPRELSFQREKREPLSW